ncbi:MAG: hypothetical protein EAZ89_06450 [Bacteroidetes bacterium]|nr:MAG: hypothetical protein EAZ89_06450 [Bacteroidota bacterium]
MRHLALLFTLPIFCLLCITCAPPAPNRTLSGQWQLIRYENRYTGWYEDEPDHIARGIVITFSDKGGRGKFDGETVTNYISGKYTIASADSVTFRDISGSLRGEPVWGERFWTALDVVTAYGRSEDLLYLDYQGDTMRMTFERR